MFLQFMNYNLEILQIPIHLINLITFFTNLKLLKYSKRLIFIEFNPIAIKIIRKKIPLLSSGL